jgi:PTH1 family peptidyl-tRNA hydrolase
VADVIAALGTKQFARLRFGIGRPPDGRTITEHVLARFTPDERHQVEGEFDRALELMEAFVGQGIEAAMNQAAAGPRDAVE